MTTRNLCDWSIVNIPSVTFEYYTVEDHSKKSYASRDVQESLTTSGYSKINFIIHLPKTAF
jgi:hypothetical protein